MMCIVSRYVKSTHCVGMCMHMCVYMCVYGCVLVGEDLGVIFIVDSDFRNIGAPWCQKVAFTSSFIHFSMFCKFL